SWTKGSRSDSSPSAKASRHCGWRVSATAANTMNRATARIGRRMLMSSTAANPLTAGIGVVGEDRQGGSLARIEPPVADILDQACRPPFGAPATQLGPPVRRPHLRDVVDHHSEFAAEGSCVGG